ncbi:MAG: hypothetical protein HQM01_15580 [Magnetococcales bacterium]|nr:hypothetical protein [Magnetococcales bacterium]
MTKRAIAGVVAVLLLSYVAGLALFMPPDRLTQGARALIGDRMSWQRFAIGWDGIRLSKVRFNPPLFNPDRDIDVVRIYPTLLPLFSGRLGAGYDIGLEFGRLEGEGTWNGHQGRLEWRLHLEELGKLAALWLGPLGAELRGKGLGSGWMNASTDEPRTLESGEGEIQLQGVVAFGAKIEPLNLSTKVKEPNLIEITLAGKGDVAVSGKLTLRVLPTDPRAGPINGEIQIQPVKTNLPGLAGQFLARGQPVRLLLSGTLATPQWRLP